MIVPPAVAAAGDAAGGAAGLSVAVGELFAQAFRKKLLPKVKEP
ncbi:hypothetical protein COO91_07595 [Nostoc flagelliforme CCNUN1]|uniref:Uncharacterized protein n=1 Tax=Nostoc flagelliforme CCNUN1 TaxID=2038116 RepID=A0A2K8T1H2_9NOSO|nr:hypothetical protein COO91_07595 [Nostoc flagelliforme CCNUN1]